MGSAEANEGERQARSLFGDARYERTRSAGDPSRRGALLRVADEVVFGTVYARPGLELRQRAICTVAALTVLGQTTQLRAHLAAALHVGVSEGELAEVITQMAMYGGFPAALNAMQVLDECLAERGVANA
jgi:4-carboxymuconolactone decarboxylase